MHPKKNIKKQNGATLGIETELWQAADQLRGHLDAADYKPVVLGLIFLKYISDRFEQVRELVEKELNRRMNHTLEEMARALFRHWFVENEEVDEG